MSKVFQPATLAGAISIALISTISFANSEANVIQLETIFVTASKSEQNIKDIPARVKIIDELNLEQSSIKALPQILQQEAALNVVQTGGYGQQSSIFLRGTNSNHTLVLRDGVRLNTNTTSAASLPFLDTTDIEKVEVLKGPASVLYGTDAIGGVVQLISKTPKKTSAFITSEAGEQKTYKAILGADLAEDGFYAQVRGQRLETDGTAIFNTNDERKYSYDQKGYSAKIGVEQNEYAASLDYNQNEGNNQYNSFGTPSSQDFENENINLKGRVNINNQVAIHARLSQFNDDLDQVTSPGYVHSKTQEAEVYSEYNLSNVQNVLLGITHRNLKAQTQAFNENFDSTGYFAQHQYNANDLNTQIGIRLEDNEKYGTKTVGQVAARYQALPLTSIYTNIGTAFKAPSLNDMYAFGGNPELKPEKSVSYEVGIDQILPFNIKTGVSVFHTKVDDLINSICVSTCDGDWQTTFPVYENHNVDKSTITGGEISAVWTYNDFFINTNYTYVKTEDKKLNTELLRRPKQSFSFTYGIQNELYGFSAAIIAKSKAKDFSRDIPGYARVDMNAYWNATPNVKLFANIENVGDVNYKTVHSAGEQYYINGGRLASAGVTLRY